VVEISVEDLPKDLELILRLEGLSERVVVTATAGPQVASRVPRVATIIEASELEVRKQTFLGDALLRLPGLRVQRLGDPGSFTTIRFRGLREVDTALLFDGHKIYDAGGFRGDITSFFQQTTLGSLERIEVVPGASSHMYGSSAVGGVINLVPQLRAGPTSIDAAFEGGALGVLRESLQASGSLGRRFHYGVGAQRIDVTNGLDEHDVFRNTAVNGLLHLDLGSNVSLSGAFFLSDSPRSDLNDSPFPIGPPGNELGFERDQGPVEGFVHDLDDPDLRRRSQLSTAIVTWTHRITDSWSYSVSYQRTNTLRDFPDGPAINPFLSRIGVSESPSELDRIDGGYQSVKTRHNIRSGRRNLILLGLEHDRESRTQEFLSRTLNLHRGPTTDRQSSTAFFLQDEVSLAGEALKLTLSFRGQHFKVDNPESVPELRGLDTPDSFTGGLALAYFLRGSATKLRAQAANGFRQPSLSERFAIFNSSVGPLRVGNPLLRPERVLTADGGVDQFLARNKVQLSATYFYNRLQEIITSRRSLFRQTNERGGLSRGAEFALRASPAKGAELFAGYAFTRADYITSAATLRSDNTIVPVGISRPFESTPKHHWSAGFSVERGRWRFTADYVGVSAYEEVLFSPRMFRRVLFEFEGYNRVDGVASYTVPRRDRTSVELYLKVDNLLNDHYFEDGFRTPGLSVWGGARYRFR
jgi:outer membrane receptor protein involved in Fe transport